MVRVSVEKGALESKKEQAVEGKGLVLPSKGVVGRIMVPQDGHGICGSVTVHGKKNLVNGIKGKDLKVERLFWIIFLGLM